MNQKLIIALTTRETPIKWCMEGIFILFIPPLSPTRDKNVCELLLRVKVKVKKYKSNIYKNTAWSYSKAAYKPRIFYVS